MKTTKQLVDEEWEELYAKEQAIIMAEREHWEGLLMEEILEAEKKAPKHAKVLLGRPRKARKFEFYATIKSPKLCRIIKNLQHK